jgi:hypothetical protein
VGAQPELREVGIFDAAPAELDADVEEGRDAFASIHPASLRPFLLDVKNRRAAGANTVARGSAGKGCEHSNSNS